MNISNSFSLKLLFLLCITFTYNVIAMKKNRYDKYKQHILPKLNPELEKIGKIQNKTFSDFLLKNPNESILYSSLCKNKEDFPTINIVEVPIVSTNNPDEIIRKQYIIETFYGERRAVREDREKFVSLLKDKESQLNEFRVNLDEQEKLISKKEEAFTEKQRLFNENINMQRSELDEQKKVFKTRNRDLRLKIEEVQKTKRSLKIQEKIVEQREGKVAQSEAKLIDLQQRVDWLIRSTFWRRNPYALGITSFLAGGLLCGVGVYYGHSRIDALVAGIVNLWRRNN